MSNAPLLALDTATFTARVAVIGTDGIIKSQGEKAAARHSGNLLRLCEEALQTAGVDLAGLGGIACGAGPGSFTGLRVGMAVAKGLALPTGLPLLLVSSLEALAWDLAAQAPAEALLLACIDAGKDQVYARTFLRRADALTPLHDDWAVGAEPLLSHVAGLQAGLPRVAGGTGVDRYAAAFKAALGASAVIDAIPGPSAGAIGRLALPRHLRGESDDLESAVPSYGRPPDITTPKRPLPK